MNNLLQSLRLFEGLSGDNANYQRIDIEKFTIDAFNKAVIQKQKHNINGKVTFIEDEQLMAST